MTTLKISDRATFINNFLSPIGKLTENTVVKVREQELAAVSSSSDGTLIVNCSLPQQNDVSDTLFLNIPDINKLIKVLGCVESEEIELLYNNNNLEYKSANVGFKYHLLEDGIIDLPSVDINKIKGIEFSFKFDVQPTIINQLIKASTFVTDTNKIYFHVNGDSVDATLTDKQRHNVDSYTQQISDQFTGTALTKDLAMNFETIRIISTLRFDSLSIHVNPELNVFLFRINVKGCNIIIVSSGYVG
jgi:hypothetical protein